MTRWNFVHLKPRTVHNHCNHRRGTVPYIPQNYSSAGPDSTLPMYRYRPCKLNRRGASCPRLILPSSQDLEDRTNRNTNKQSKTNSNVWQVPLLLNMVRQGQYGGLFLVRSCWFSSRWKVPIGSAYSVRDGCCDYGKDRYTVYAAVDGVDEILTSSDGCCVPPNNVFLHQNHS
jgi:hypothetical protein